MVNTVDAVLYWARYLTSLPFAGDVLAIRNLQARIDYIKETLGKIGGHEEVLARLPDYVDPVMRKRNPEWKKFVQEELAPFFEDGQGSNVGFKRKRTRQTDPVVDDILKILDGVTHTNGEPVETSGDVSAVPVMIEAQGEAMHTNIDTTAVTHAIAVLKDFVVRCTYNQLLALVQELRSIHETSFGRIRVEGGFRH